MPKEARPDSYWRERLAKYASGAIRFGTGEKPPASSRWGQVGLLCQLYASRCTHFRGTLLTQAASKKLNSKTN